MKCYQHPDNEAVATCKRCGKAICQSCAVNVSGNLLCPTCLSLSTSTPPSSKPTNTLAIISLVLGILSLCFGMLTSIPAWITGHLAIKQIKEEPNQEGLQFANIGKWMGIVITAIYSIMLACYLGMVFLSVISSLLQNR